MSGWHDHVTMAALIDKGPGLTTAGAERAGGLNTSGKMSESGSGTIPPSAVPSLTPKVQRGELFEYPKVKKNQVF